MGERLSRLRRTAGLRAMVRENSVQASQLIYPVFVQEGLEEPVGIDSMPGQARLPISAVGKVAVALSRLGVHGILVFGLPSNKDATGSAAADPDGVVPRAIRAIREAAPEMVILTDVCLCSYTEHGHCGILRGSDLDTEATQGQLAKVAVAHAAAGADVVAPSSMVDGQVRAIRAGLDEAGFSKTAILAYTAKFASSFYGPFREAADSAPMFGDRRAYQHDPANSRHARREARADEAEGADLIVTYFAPDVARWLREAAR